MCGVSGNGLYQECLALGSWGTKDHQPVESGAGGPRFSHSEKSFKFFVVAVESRPHVISPERSRYPVDDAP